MNTFLCCKDLREKRQMTLAHTHVQCNGMCIIALSMLGKVAWSIMKHVVLFVYVCLCSSFERFLPHILTTRWKAHDCIVCASGPPMPGLCL